MTQPTRDLGREVRELYDLAGWYRTWAAATDSAEEKANRLALAEALERKARALDF